MESLQDIGQAQQERLFHIDFRAAFLGSVTRADIMRRFGVKEAAATRDLAVYRRLAPRNLVYRTDTRLYLRADAFAPLFAHEPLQTLTAIADGFGDDAVGAAGPYVRAERPARLNQPSIEIIAAVTRAIAAERVLRIRYRSLSSGAGARVIAPFALLDNGLRWHVRAWDRARGRFGDFVLTRMESAEVTDAAPEPHERWEEDDAWTRRVTLRLRPHPGLAHPEAVALDYAMEDGEAAVRVRAAAVGYVLQRLGVDCSPDASLPPDRHQLRLINLDELAGVSNLAIAPGYVAPGSASAVDADG